MYHLVVRRKGMTKKTGALRVSAVHARLAGLRTYCGLHTAPDNSWFFFTGNALSISCKKCREVIKKTKQERGK